MGLIPAGAVLFYWRFRKGVYWPVRLLVKAFFCPLAQEVQGEDGEDED